MDRRETEMGGDSHRFPSTSWTFLDELRKADPEERRRKLEELISQYWKPVYCVIRSGWSKSNEDAKDLTQEFFVRAVLDGSLVNGFDRDRGSFRTFLKGALSHFLLNQARDQATQKRGGQAKVLSLESEEVELSDFIPDGSTLPPERLFDLAWKNVVLGRALRRLEERLASQGKSECFQIFRRYEFESGAEPPSYRTLGDELGISPDVVKHALVKARGEFRLAVTDVLCGYVAESRDLADEMRELFGS